jgi:3-isopropylmalate/(R)-2-methylmalate dehydratase small subunit
MAEREPLRAVRSRVVVLPAPDIDTDQIIPARFLTTTSRTGLGAHLFADWRYDEQGLPRADFALERDDARGAAILVTGPNFGCGSSREHAPWALLDYGFRAVISTRFADIFRNNALKNGLLPIAVSADAHARIVALHREQPHAELAIDVAQRRVTLPDGTAVDFPLDPFAHQCLLAGVDELGWLLALGHEIAAFEARAGGAAAGGPAR